MPHEPVELHWKVISSLLCHMKYLWPAIAFCAIGYSTLQAHKLKLEETSALAVKTAEKVSVLEQAVAVQTALLEVQTTLLTEIKTAVEGIRRRGERER